MSLDGGAAADAARPKANPFSAWPAAAGFGLYLEVTLTVRGTPDPVTGYLADIADLDRTVRRSVLGLLVPSDGDLHAKSAAPAITTPAILLRRVLESASIELGVPVIGASVALTPALTMSMSDLHRHRVLLTQTFEFAASHRLHCPDLSEERNREIFGKCNNPHGHGHNYRLEAMVECQVDHQGVATPDLHRIESIVRRTVIDRLDHRHLNLDVPEFAALNPSVENIARVIHDLLAPPLAEVGGTLRQVRLWETEKTSCIYPATEPVLEPPPRGG